MEILYIILSTILGAFCYRVGGMSKEEAKQKIPWFPQALVKGWFRDVNCTLLSLGYWLLFIPKVDWWWYVLASVGTFFSLRSYFSWLPPKKGVDKFYYHGLFIGLASLFVLAPAGLWIGGLIRSGVLAIFMGVWCALFTSVDIEEYSRGASIFLTNLIRR